MSYRFFDLTLSAVMICTVVIAPVYSLAADSSGAPADRLVQLLVSKGVLTDQDAKVISGVPVPLQHDRLLGLLREKGVISAAEFSSLTTPSASARVDRSLVASTTPSEPLSQAATPPPVPAKAEAPKPIPSAPVLRVLQLEPSKPEGMIPDLKLGSGASMKFYGQVKASTIYDTSSPYGTDMPLPAFIGTTFDPGPNSSEFHVKARFARFGTQFQWPGIGDSTTITGKFEFDFEGNFTRVLNRNISTIRSSQASIRVAYGRIDHQFTDQTSMFALFGQDWTPFGSSTLPNLFETTGLGLGFGTLYERAPQFRFGLGHKFDTSRNLFFQPEVAVVLPAFGNDPTLIDNQLAYGERQGADSGRPEIQARLVTQWQLDRAPGVAPAQFILSGVNGERTALVRAENIPADAKPYFPHGASVSSPRDGWTAELQLPTRYVTLITKYWNGSDLRWYFVGSLFSNFNDPLSIGLTCPGAGTVFKTCEAPSNDGSSTVIFGLGRLFCHRAAKGNPFARRFYESWVSVVPHLPR